MKCSIVAAAAIILSLPAVQAQQPDTALLYIHYKFSHLRDTSNRANPYKENMVLVIGKNAAVYRSYQRQLENAAAKKNIQQQISAGGPVQVNLHFTGSGSEYFQYPNDHKLVRKESLFGNFLVTESLPVINWQVTADTTTLGSLHCQKATGHFKGRDYIAWFCPDLPLHVGPWELNGLPGVIVEAYDDKKEVQFLFDGVENVAPAAQAESAAATPPGNQGNMPPPLPGMEDMNNDPAIIKLPDDATKTTDKEFAKLQAAFRKDPNAFAQSMMAARNGGMAGDNGPRPKMDFRAAPSQVINNPIELPEKP
ncbi:MAG TPA: GLPGLI family protein [Puia sp.]|nr:GLPGLI family protein [Puia sp.]